MNVNKNYVKKETLTITRTQELSLVDGTAKSEQVSKKHIFDAIWKLFKKYVLSDKEEADKDDG